MPVFYYQYLAHQAIYLVMLRQNQAYNAAPFNRHYAGSQAAVIFFHFVVKA